ncbi:hypothetical protein [Scytonema sp. NUACC21]
MAAIVYRARELLRSFHLSQPTIPVFFELLLTPNCQDSAVQLGQGLGKPHSCLAQLLQDNSATLPTATAIAMWIFLNQAYLPAVRDLEHTF